MGFPLSPQHRVNSSQKARKIMRDDGFLMNLPPQITVEILSRLPPKSIIQCKSVCKKWLELIDDPHFVRLHFSNSKAGLVVLQSQMFKRFYKLVDFDENANDHHNIAYNTMVKFSLSSLSSFLDANIVVDGSIEGFLFLRDINYKHETLYICNPVTREYMELPRPKEAVRHPSVVTHGFGVTQKSREYKVVRIFQDRVLHPISGACLRIPYSDCQVYTLGTEEWRSIGEVPFAYDSDSIGLFFKGNLHWLIKDLEGNELISCFDLENEVFQPFPPPFPGRKLLGSLGVLKGYLCLCDNSSFFDIDIWVMKEYGVEKSWGKEFVIRKIPQLSGPTHEIVRALKVFRDGSILLLWGDYCMLYYCSKSKVIHEVDMERPSGPNCIEAMNYVPSLLSLKSLLKKDVISF